MPPPKGPSVVVGFADSDVQAHLFVADHSVKVSSVTVEVATKNEGAPREIGHAIRVAPTDVELPLQASGKHPQRREPPIVVYPDGTVWVDPSIRRHSK
ncbi:hypothetical protein O4160_22210 [Rhodococcus sp. IEGM 1401]|uniref:hypothetical protein n=1 Tax=unclassified Rhodococcus (in: high G+C Gram-positive bacteria) TaxID=192944 RepID=UPI0022B44330|nr:MULTISPECIES: hypothetical protein [unclassified Rhodococcus (in: high G+C Gram-positive bacteria)]MCZ4563557.1 hypothetical protein [Rhodococcus sp. IEGM 1401]MDI9923687.1 hypothetical protein [Rhodococcus sp. IEGM 1372]MDV8036172.1 hypothetical protein [Rhodococcus sp. IEGM 1414]